MYSYSPDWSWSCQTISDPQIDVVLRISVLLHPSSCYIRLPYVQTTHRTCIPDNPPPIFLSSSECSWQRDVYRHSGVHHRAGTDCSSPDFLLADCTYLFCHVRCYRDYCLSVLQDSLRFRIAWD